MSKLKKPLFSLSSQGSLGKVISFVKRGGRNIAEKKPEVPDARTLAQLSWRHMYQKAVALWHLLSVTERQEWESLARSKHMTGFAWFVSQALKPNPGLYLPLQGGKMAGDIDMDKHRILKLPMATDDQEAASKKYHDDNLPPGGYTEGCKVYRSTDQSIPHGTYTYIDFDTEDYDTDEMADLVVDSERITIKTAGIYLLTFHCYWAAHSTGYRRGYIRKGGVTNLVDFRMDAPNTPGVSLNMTTIDQLAVNDYLRCRVYQNSGNALFVMFSNHYSPFFMAQRIG